MSTTDSPAWLREYAESGSEPASQEEHRRHETFEDELTRRRSTALNTILLNICC